MFQFEFDSLPGVEVLAKMVGVNVRFRVPKMVREDGMYIFDVEVHGTIGRVTIAPYAACGMRTENRVLDECKTLIVQSSDEQLALHPDENGWTVKFEAHVIDGKEGHAGHFTVHGPLIPTK